MTEVPFTPITPSSGGHDFSVSPSPSSASWGSCQLPASVNFLAHPPIMPSCGERIKTSGMRGSQASLRTQRAQNQTNPALAAETGGRLHRAVAGFPYLFSQSCLCGHEHILIFSYTKGAVTGLQHERVIQHSTQDTVHMPPTHCYCPNGPMKVF